MNIPRSKNSIGLAVAGLLCAAIWVLAQTPQPDPDKVAEWEAEGSAEDSSGQGNHGTAYSVSYAPGVHGQAFELDGKTSYLTTPVDTRPEQHPYMTWSAWVLPRKLAGNHLILSAYWDGWCRALLIQDGRFMVYTGEAWLTPESADAGVWQHIAVIFTPDEIRFYKNGVEYFHDHKGGTSGASAPLVIGRNPRAGEFFSGLIDEVEIFERALSSEDVVGLYNKYSKQASATAPESSADAYEENAPTAFEPPNITPIAGVAEASPTLETPKEKAPETATSSMAQDKDRFGTLNAPAGTTPAGTKVILLSEDGDQTLVSIIDGGMIWVNRKTVTLDTEEKPASKAVPEKPAFVLPQAESPAVAAAIAANDPAALAKAAVNERWNHNIAADLTRPNPKLAGKLSRLKGKAALVAFCPAHQDFGAEEKTAQGAPQSYFEPIIEAALGPEATAGKLEVVIVAPDPAIEIQKVIAKRTPKGQTPPKITIVEDPKDELRRSMGLYSTPYLLFDADGDLVWSVRGGQRDNRTGFGAEDLKTALAKVAWNRHIKKAKPAPLRPPEKSEQSLFTFEDGTQGWTFTGDWHGTSSEADFPGLVKGFEGHKFLSSFPPNGAPPTGIAVSPPFKVTKRYLHFKVGGGDLADREGVALVCDGSTQLVATGKNTFELNLVTWDLADLAGKTARLVAYDAGKTEMRDGIMLDAVFASDSPLPPPSFADHHDPNNPKHAARIAADVPEDYKAFQNGDFHCEVENGPTYLLEYNVPFETDGTPFQACWFYYPSTEAQTATDQKAEVVLEGQTKAGKLVEDKTDKTWPNTLWPKALVVKLDRPPQKDRRGNFHWEAKVQPKSLIFQKGAAKNVTPPDQATRVRITNSHPEVRHPEMKKIMEKEGIMRWPQEQDSAYLLRLICWMKRYWTSTEQWGGWPTSGAFTLPDATEMEKKALACPAVGSVMSCLLLSGIPVEGGQGLWLNEATENEVGQHVRGLVFLEKVGWILIDDDKPVYSPTGMFTFGRGSGTNFCQGQHDPVAVKLAMSWWGMKRDHGKGAEAEGRWSSHLIEAAPKK